MNEKEAPFILNKYWIKEILEMNNENDLNPDVLVASNTHFYYHNNIMPEIETWKLYTVSEKISIFQTVKGLMTNWSSLWTFFVSINYN